MKRACAMSMQYATAFVCFSFVLTGCSSIPIRTGRASFDNHYRRIPYKTEGDRRVIDILYATDRVAKKVKGPSVAFGRDLLQSMTYGTLNITVSPVVKLGKMLPKRLQRSGVIGIEKVSNTEEDLFLKQVADVVKASPHNSLMVVVSGDYDDFESAAIKAAYFTYLLDANTPVLLFDWPGDQAISIGGYKKAQKFAVASAPRLEELLVKIIRQAKPKKLWINASSTGCQVVCDAAEQMYKDDNIPSADFKIDHIVLNAPDVGKDEFSKRFKKALSAVARKVTIYVSSDDRALLISGIINRKQRLGRMKIREPKLPEKVKDMLYLKSLNPSKVTLIDVTPINTASFKHGYYLESPEFYDDFYARIFDQGPNVSRRAYLLKSENGTDYWVLQGDR